MPDRIPLTLSVKDAAALKWDLGRSRYRTADQPFKGEPLYEAYEDALDVRNYLWEEARADKLGPSPEALELIERAETLARDIHDLALRRRAERSA